jgi:hypothetical protein
MAAIGRATGRYPNDNPQHIRLPGQLDAHFDPYHRDQRLAAKRLLCRPGLVDVENWNLFEKVKSMTPIETIRADLRRVNALIAEVGESMAIAHAEFMRLENRHSQLLRHRAELEALGQKLIEEASK